MDTIYLSFDIEADGPSPQLNNMLSIGICGTDHRGQIIVEWERNIFPRYGKSCDPDTMLEFWSKNQDAWRYINKNRISASQAMAELDQLIYDLSSRYNKIIWLAWPAAFDWQWLNCYYQEAAQQQPGTFKSKIGHKATCMSSVWAHVTRNLSKGEETALWKQLSPEEQGNHTPLVDARVQATRYFNLLKYISPDHPVIT